MLGKVMKYKNSELIGVVTMNTNNRIKVCLLNQSVGPFSVVSGSTIEDKLIHFEEVVKELL